MHRSRLFCVVIHLRPIAVCLNRLTSIIIMIQDSHQSSWYAPEVVIVLTKKCWQCHTDVMRVATRSLNIAIGTLSNGYGNFFHPMALSL
jgi:hypothetical protein